jgi:chromosome segregation ATPase
MGRIALLALVALAACKSRSLNFLEREAAKFRTQNEEIRDEDLEARYERAKAKADALDAVLLALQQRRDDLYARYDELRAEIARLGRDGAAAEQERGALAKALVETRARAAALLTVLVAVVKAAEAVERELDDARERRAALEARKNGADGPE